VLTGVPSRPAAGDRAGVPAGGLQRGALRGGPAIHQNTLRHRLERFEAVTGVELKNLESAFEVWWRW